MGKAQKSVSQETLQHLLNEMAGLTGEKIKAEVKRLDKRFDAIEAEIRAGHQRLGKLEGQGGND